MMATPSKNQRSGPKQKPRVNYCPKGHELTPIWVARRGRKTMQMPCACDGYAPMVK